MELLFVKVKFRI